MCHATLRVACSTIVIQCNTRIFTLQSGFALRHLVLVGNVSQRGKKVDPGVICTFQYRFTPYSNLHHLHKKKYAGPCCKQQASLFPADTTARRKEKSGQTRLLKGLGKQCISYHAQSASQYPSEMRSIVYLQRTVSFT